MHAALQAALIGYGKMGKLIEEHAPHFGIRIRSRIDRHLPSGTQTHPSLSKQALEGCDIAFDFATAQGILDRVRLYVQTQIPVVIGTTGCEGEIEQIKKLVQNQNGSILYSPNFALGVALFLELISQAAHLFAPFDQYDVSCLEAHHRQKKDYPSGTAKEIEKRLLQNHPRKKKAIYQLPDGPIDREHLHIASTRAGFHPVMHEVSFDSEDGTVTIKHEARNRNDFAKGALQCATWLYGKKGFFTMNDFLQEKCACT
jgi:4-hydroxy-tetrahydrodipicolinate reductase